MILRPRASWPGVAEKKQANIAMGIGEIIHSLNNALHGISRAFPVARRIGIESALNN